MHAACLLTHTAWLYSPRRISSVSHGVLTNYRYISHMYGWYFHLEDVNQMFMLGWSLDNVEQIS